MHRDELLTGVSACVAKVVDADPACIRENARIIRDLGADSLDLLDLVFRLEQEFGIRIKTRDIERRAQAELGDVPMVVDGVYTAAAREQLCHAMPEVPASEVADGLRPSDLPYLFRVATFANLVSRLVEEQHG